MLHKTRGIVINYIRYRETSIIAKIYTEKFGIQSYIENGVRSSKGKNRIALFQPLTLLDLVLYHDDKKEIHRISEIKSAYPFKSLPYDVYKSSIGMFLDEVLNKTLKENNENLVLFDFLYHSFIFLDETEHHFENFHLIFLLKYTFFLGFSPHDANEILAQLRDANILIPFDSDYVILMNQLITADYQTPIGMSRGARNHLLETIILFYQLHVEDFGEMKSLQVLREVLS
jgi:DNA repair protein RecO (recombination protein O)